jgi:hypothetical protein
VKPPRPLTDLIHFLNGLLVPMNSRAWQTYMHFKGGKIDALNALRKYADETKWIEKRLKPIGWFNLIQIHFMFESLWQDEEFKRIIE